MNRSSASFVSVIAGCLALLALWVSGQSFWIDECNAAVKAIQPDLRSFWATFSGMKGSDFQMPLYMFLLWCWEKIVGRSEFALRALNILFAWGAILLVASRRTLPRRFRLFWCLFAAVSPMQTAYMDEARPYTLQFLAATLVWFGMFSKINKTDCDRWDIPMFSAGIVLLCASSLTGVLFAFWPCLWLLGLLCRRRILISFLREHATSVALSLCGLIPLASFYLHTLMDGARASGMGKPDFQTLGFCLYEFTGFMGVGPSRLALRDNPITAVKVFLPWIGVFGLVMFMFFIVSLAATRKKGKAFRFPKETVVCSGLGILSMVMVGAVTGMRVLARHWMPALPVLLFVFAWLADAAWKEAVRLKVLVVLFLFACLGSSVSFRFSSRHAKDDYRTAAAIAKEHLADEKTVWWAADGAATVFYGVVDCRGGCVHRLMGETEDDMESLPFPDLIIFSKPDVYDRAGVLARFLKRHSFSEKVRVPAFSFYTKIGVPFMFPRLPYARHSDTMTDRGNTGHGSNP